MTRHQVAALGDLPLGGLTRVVVDGAPICLARIADGRVYAIGDRCTHEGTSLSDGELVATEVECPMHLSRFDVLTGIVKSPPAEDRAQTYAVSVEQGLVYIEVP